MDWSGILVGVPLFLLVLLLGMNAGAVRCPQCGKQRAFHLHQRKGGGPTRRYKDNPLTCRACGWSELAERERTAAERRVEAQRAATAREKVAAERRAEETQRTATEAQRAAAAQEAQWGAQQERAGGLKEEHLQAARERDAAERERLAAKFKAEAAEQAGRDEARAKLAVVVHLLKYVALADRRVRDEERLAAVGIVERFFPDTVPAMVSRDVVIRLFDTVAPDVFSATDYAKAISESPREAREAVYGELAALAAADGKVTKAETERLAILRGALGLAESPRPGDV